MKLREGFQTKKWGNLENGPSSRGVFRNKKKFQVPEGIKD